MLYIIVHIPNRMFSDKARRHKTVRVDNYRKREEGGSRSSVSVLPVASDRSQAGFRSC